MLWRWFPQTSSDSKGPYLGGRQPAKKFYVSWDKFCICTGLHTFQKHFYIETFLIIILKISYDSFCSLTFQRTHHLLGNSCPTQKFNLSLQRTMSPEKSPSVSTAAHGLLTSQLSFDGYSESWKWDLHHPLPQKPKWLQATALKSLKLPGTGGSEFPAGQCGPLSNQPRAWVSRTRFSGSMWLRILFPLLSINWTTKVKAIRVSTKKGLSLFPPCSFCQFKTNQLDEGPQCGPSLAMETLRWLAWRKGSGI